MFSGGETALLRGCCNFDVDFLHSTPWLGSTITQQMKYVLKALLILSDEAAKGWPESLTLQDIPRAGTAATQFPGSSKEA